MSDPRSGGGADGSGTWDLAGGGWRAGRVFISHAPGEGSSRLAETLKDELAAAGIDGRSPLPSICGLNKDELAAAGIDGHSAWNIPGSGPSARDGELRAIGRPDCLVAIIEGGVPSSPSVHEAINYALGRGAGVAIMLEEGAKEAGTLAYGCRVEAFDPREFRAHAKRVAGSLAAGGFLKAPSPDRPGHSARRLLARRNVLSEKAGNFAQNRHYDLLYGGPTAGAKKPAVLFTAVPHRLGRYDAITTAGFSEWVKGIVDLEIEGNTIPLRGLEQKIDAESLTVVERRHDELPAKAVKSYREFHSTGLFEYGTSIRYLRLGGAAVPSLVLCHVVGDFWGFLLHTRLFYQKIGQDAPFTVILSVRNSSSLALGNYGDEATYPRWGIKRSHTHLPADARTALLHIRLQRDLGPAGEMTDSGIALAAKDMAREICSAYGQDAPKCYDESGQFSWDLWEMVSR